MTDSPFYAKNGLVVNNNIFVVSPSSNSLSALGIIYLNQSETASINSTFYSGQSFDAQNLLGVPADQYVNTAQFSGNLNLYQTIAGMNVAVKQIEAVNNQSMVSNNGGVTTWDTSVGVMATITMSGNTTFAEPTNMANGTYVLIVVQDSAGSHHITWNSAFKWPAGVAPTLSTAGNAKDMLSFVFDGTNLYGSYVIGLA